VGAAGLTDLQADVAVVGGGPAGAAAAATARAAGLEVCLLAGRPRHVPAAESLPPGTDRIVAELFGPAALGPKEHRRAYGNRSAWGREALDIADFMFDPLGSGWHIDRPAFDAGLIDAVGGRGVQVVVAQLRRAQRRRSAWELDARTRHGPLRVRVRFVIDAGGRTARFARAAGARRRRLDRLVAIVWPLAGGRDRDATTTVEATRDGWWYTSPQPGGRRVVAFVTDADLLPRRRDRLTAGWWPTAPPPGHVAAVVRDGGYQPAGKPQATDAATTCLEILGDPTWLATGDAAVSVDPLSSQGILTALAMGGEAGRAAAAAELGGEPTRARAAYARRYSEVLRDYLALRAAYYALEKRWPDALFWSRRHGTWSPPSRSRHVSVDSEHLERLRADHYQALTYI
jgi:flavin-dependent dehydrogenase